jgi:putative transposase
MRQAPSVGQICHICNRGVEKRIIFSCDSDKSRFINGLYFYNDRAETTNITRLFEVGLRTKDKDKRDKLVEIIGFVLMPNHYHLIVKQIQENGITEFMRKLGTGYTNYFNIKNKRVGPLFQGKYKIVIPENDQQLRYLPHYVHLNPVEIFNPGWKDNGIIDINKTLSDLSSYKWSSYLNYLGGNLYSEIIEKEELSDMYYPTSEEYKKDLEDWLRDDEDCSKSDFEQFD